MSIQIQGRGIASTHVSTEVAAPHPKEAAPHASAPTAPGDTFEVQGAAGHPVQAHFGSRVDSHAKGAYFRKVESEPSTHHRGITGRGTLPQVSTDPSRQFHGTGNTAWQTGPLERPSVYMGGRSGNREVDAGLTWDRVYDSHGQATFTDDPRGSDMRDPSHRFVRATVEGQPALVDGHTPPQVVARGKADVDAKLKTLRENFAFRPFWRDTNPDTPADKHWHNPPTRSEPGAKPEEHNQYFYPGEHFTMTLQAQGPGEVRMDIRLEGNKEHQHFTSQFHQEGWGPGKESSFKRVNSVDQFIVRNGERVGAEKFGVEPTRTAATGGSWEEVSLLNISGKREPMTGSHFTTVKGVDTAAHYAEIFGISGSTDRGGERIDIHPGAARR
ncbi:hypothetical protein [Corallococcus llansteffanensis]|uniref:Uncharacterized protein n=1 Tax=Corallococcus llansteffanensis TaxID=2316731 RepID=A0A3A8PPF8_9BACT|nr:hypothetical protein [Corallococcus llansteffanensis]RKH58297.1 hypothetical protein D7V93_16985 [Corallococcus llansteffanensis]